MTMAAKKSCRDSISSLPDEVLGQILSLVPTKTAASTSVLSKRWRNLLPLVHNLDFDETVVVNHPNRKAAFTDFMDKTIAQLGDSPIKKLSLTFVSEICGSYIYKLLEREVLELEFSSPYISLEPEFFFSKTLVKLTLSDGVFFQQSGGVLFPALKTLTLFRVAYAAFSPADVYGWLLASPVLEEFNVCDDEPRAAFWVKEVWGTSIKRISILFHSNDQEDYSYLRIDTPNLVYLDCSSYVAQDYDVQLDSLVEARLDLRSWKYCVNARPRGYRYQYDPAVWGDATKLIAAIRNVETLHLSADSLVVFYFCCKSMPNFYNLVKLSFESHEERGWQVLPLLLKKSTNLETLVIKGLVHEITDQCGDVCVHEKKKKKNKKRTCLLSCRVKFLTIHGYGGSCEEVKQMRHFMENLRCLEVVKVKVQQDKHANDLMKLLPTVSSKCKIHFV